VTSPIDEMSDMQLQKQKEVSTWPARSYNAALVFWPPSMRGIAGMVVVEGHGSSKGRRTGGQAIEKRKQVYGKSRSSASMALKRQEEAQSGRTGA
jgi:hypothetical protein